MGSACMKHFTSSSTTYLVSTRMKKVAPPPPGAFCTKPAAPLSNGDLRRQSSHEPPLTAPLPMSSAPGEDCAFDELLEGRMDLEVVLPDNRRVRMTVDRRTPMMDLLVHAATTNKISPAGHVIKVLSKEERNVLYKPNTPIGSLDVNTVYIVPKPTNEIPVKRMPRLANQPFEQTFRLQVNLPRNQRMVLRVSPRITLAELKRQICNEKELDLGNHHLVHPAQPDTVLDLNSTLDDYGCAEINVMSSSGLRDSIRNTSAHLIAYPRTEDDRKKKGILRLFSRKKKEASTETSPNGLNSRGVSPTRSVANRESYQPKQSTKRKPAPAPPAPAHPPSPPPPPLVIQSSSSINSRPESEVSAKTDELGSTVSHSRHSSDSSGYHEPSVFSDCSENKSPEASIVHGGNVLSGNDSTSCRDIPDSLNPGKSVTNAVRDSTNLKTVPSCSSTSIVSTTRKRKAPLPPAPVLHEVETPSSPEEQPSDVLNNAMTGEVTSSSRDEELKDSEVIASSSECCSDAGELEREAGTREPSKTDEPTASSARETETSDGKPLEQEAAALQYFENVLKESECPERADSPDELQSDTEEPNAADVPQEAECCAQTELVCESEERDVEHPDSVPVPSVVPTELSPTACPAVSSACDASVEDLCIDSSCASEREALPVDHECNGELSSIQTGVKVISAAVTNQLGERKSVVLTTNKYVPVPLPRLSLKRKTLSPQNIIGTSQKPLVPSIEDLSSEESIEEPKVEYCDVEVHAEFDAQGLQTNEQIRRAVMRDSSSSPIQWSPVLNEPKFTESLEHCKNQLPNEEPSSVPPSTDEHCDSPAKCEVKPENCGTGAEDAATEPQVTPSTQRKLVNFAMGCYRSQETDIYSEGAREHSKLETSVPSPKSENTGKEREEPVEKAVPKPRVKRQMPAVKIVPFQERDSVQKTDSSVLEDSIRGQVQKRCTELSGVSTLPLTGRSASLYSLPAQKKVTGNKPVPASSESSIQCLKRVNSDQNVSWDAPADEEKSADFIQEQTRLQEEYLKLQAQFISWQKQLLNNQSLLQSEIVQKMPFPTLEQYKLELSRLPSALHKASSAEVIPDDLKTRSLPRPKPQPLHAVDVNLPKSQSSYGNECSENKDASRQEEPSVRPKVFPRKPSSQKEGAAAAAPSEPTEVGTDVPKSQTLPRPVSQTVSAFKPPRTMTLNRQVRPKSQVVSVTIGSWQQRNETAADIDSASVASSRSMFQSLENIPLEQSRTAPPVPLQRKKKVSDLTGSQDKQGASEKQNGEEKASASKQLSRAPESEATKDVKPETRQTRPEKPQVLDRTKAHSAKVEKKASESAVRSKPSKPFVRVSSMKDEPQSPPLQALKKWPLPEIREKEAAPKNEKRSVWEELKATARLAAGESREKVTRAEVDLRKRRMERQQAASSTATTPKSAETDEENRESAASKVHVTKINIYSSDKEAKKSIETSAKSKVASETSKKRPQVKGSEPFNTELKQVLLKRASTVEQSRANGTTEEPTYAEAKVSSTKNQGEPSATNGSSSPPPPPPPPVSTMPTIPPAAPIPKSSQLLMDKKGTSTKVKKEVHTVSKKDPREELMLEIRGFGGRQALRKVPATQTSWHMKVYGSTPAVNS